MFYLNPYHLVQMSPWPLIGALGALFLTSGLALWFHGWSLGLTVMGLVVILLTMYHWWRDVIRESTYQGYHTAVVVRGLKFGMVLFIISEVCFFFAFFWAFFHMSLSPDMSLGNSWPPRGIETLDPWGVPLLNTVILLSSGVTVTWAHHAMLCGQSGLIGILFTVLLGVWFTFIQASEYMEVSFAISDSVFGSTFFVATGFHGLHVIIGTAFLFVNLLRVYVNHFSTSHHVGFEAAAWYWHFVDVVWLFLFMSIYYWGTWLIYTADLKFAMHMLWLTMLDIFANFDPEYNILGSTAFWIMMCVSPLFLYNLASGRSRSITTKLLYSNPMSKVNHTGMGFTYTTSIFLLILYYNFIGIMPYTFSWTSHLVVNLSLSLLLWLSIVMMSFSSNPSSFMAHLVPTGTPLPLAPFLVLIESISISVRPLTLAVRLTANIMTGHIIMSMITSPIFTSFYMIFEGAICIVQAYIFTLLPTLYMDEHV